jgi:hypothetical protein
MRFRSRSVALLLTILVAALALVAFAAGTAQARLLFTAGDPALQGAVVLDLDAGLGFVPGQMQASVQLPGGTTLDIRTTHAAGFFGNFFGPGEVFAGRFPDGVTLDFSPPVSAVGVFHTVHECSAVATFEGSADDEAFTSQPGEFDFFVGAADIGDISRIVLNDGCFAAAYSQIRVVEGSVPPPSAEADLALRKSTAVARVSQADGSVPWDLRVDNAGPDDSDGARTIDFLPRGTQVLSSSPPHAVLPGTRLAQQGVGSLGPGASFPLALETSIPPFYPSPDVDTIFSCQSTMLNVALVTATSLDLQNADDVASAAVAFDTTSRLGTGEICDNGQDDDCDGRVDCSQLSCRSHPHCRPPVVWGAAEPWDCFQAECLFPPDPPAPMSCQSHDVHGRPIDVPAHCCAVNGPRVNGRAPDECNPIRDPNFKQADPPVNAVGYGYTEAGRLHTYWITYENTGEADALDVRVLDRLDEDLDDATLLVADGGLYDPATRMLEWTDPVVPPATPRSVHFEVAVRGDAPPFTHVRNQATAIFPNAVPSERLDTNVVEHLVMEPGAVAVDPGVVGCSETAPGSGEWNVSLFNKGNAEAWNASAEILNPPASVEVTRGEVAFGAPHHLAGSPDRLTIPLNATPSLGTVAFTTETPDDPCRSLWWRIRWQPAPGEDFAHADVQVDPDGDLDAVADGRDNCPADYNPAQADSDGDGVGDACEPPPSSLAAISDLTASGKAGVATVEWTPPTAADHYDVYRSGDGGPFVRLATGYLTPKGVWQDHSLEEGIEYAYRVVWYDAEGDASPPSNEATAVPVVRRGKQTAACGLVGVEVLLVLALSRRRKREYLSR